ncbi:phosphomethylethanolamine N-methyltransferase-like isoform X2 [Anguilla anguilla]|uniref:phosphomethylethanolamine N-methyltransferase-like isoform X2 n=1 Tax=Anguilla anguilla TaxID=7936 RepID=UPI0015AE1CEB|nr:phosphomethylethanolamine N-methyltransferase-like isoform X2 [Anguilla anguilla]
MEEGLSRSEMMKFWQEHSHDASVEEMMLDSSALLLTQHELPEIMGLLPNLQGTRLLELGAGIGRFTHHFAQYADHVTAVDFMEKFVEKNKQDNSHHRNVDFIHSDVTQLNFSKNSFGFIFSNWLMMYLSNEELVSLVKNMLLWLQPGGYLFFRESCFYQAGDGKRDFDPTHFRSPAEYNHLMTSALQKEMGEGGEQAFGFEVVMSKSVQTYIKMKNNPNQVCWLMQKVPRSECHKGFNTFQDFLDNQQYSRRGILRYEKIFGNGYVSTGGPSTTKEFVDLLNLSPGQIVLDVGCGIGGGDFYMARTFGVKVLGMDLSSNMVEIATERAMKENLPSVQFEVGDATRRVFKEGSFDVIYSRDTILHIADKLKLFKSFYSWLKPGGKVLISDYCCGEMPWSPEFQEYVKQRGYILFTPPQYGKFLEQAGFSRVRAEDRTSQFIQVVRIELEKAEAIREEYIKEFSEEDYNAIVTGWNENLQRCTTGDQRWGLFYADRD